MNCFFVSDLHGRTDRYEKLFRRLSEELPTALFMGGDLLPSGLYRLTSNQDGPADFFQTVIRKGFQALKEKLKDRYPKVFVILGNDDGKADEPDFLDGEREGLWEYIHNRKAEWAGFEVYGYSYIPPTPFLMKDWERYDISRYVDPGCVHPSEGFHTIKTNDHDLLYSTIKEDIERLTSGADFPRSIFLFHTPPYQTNLDRAALDGMTFEYVPLDVHIGSIAVRRLIEKKQPLLTLHGHVHESAEITGCWQDRIGKTYLLSAAHNGPELALIRFDPGAPESAKRDLL